MFFQKISWKRLYGNGLRVCFFSIALTQVSGATTLDDCILQTMQTSDDNVTLGELRLKCKERIEAGSFSLTQKNGTELPVVEDRIHQDKKHVLQPYTLMTHKPNYLLLGSYNASSYNADTYRQEFDDPNLEFDDVEAKFQFSVKFPLLVNLFDDRMDIYAAYTNRSFWQVYNTAESAPFRETNHEPEAWVQFHPRWEFFGFTNAWNSFGIVHQSNGRGGLLSRSWNRVYGWFTVENGNLAMSFKPWYRLPEDTEDDDNPDITDYLGHYELTGTYKLGEHVFSVMSRNNLESGFKKGAVELSWSFPLGDYPFLKGYVQYFNGYGESLIDYNQHSNSTGIGFSLTDWL